MCRFHNYFLLLIFIFAGISLHSKQREPLRELFLSLPDSVFTGTYCFSTIDSFPKQERLLLLDSSDLPMTSENGIRFHLQEYSDSLGKLAFTNSADSYVVLRILEKNKKEIFFCIQSYSCDFVMCSYRMHFYLRKGKKLEELKNVLPTHFPLRLFFDKNYLAEMQVNPGEEIDGIEYHFADSCSDLIVTINGEFFDKELFGERHPMVRLDLDKMIRNELRLRLVGRKYVIVQ